MAVCLRSYKLLENSIPLHVFRKIPLQGDHFESISKNSLIRGSISIIFLLHKNGWLLFRGSLVANRIRTISRESCSGLNNNLLSFRAWNKNGKCTLWKICFQIRTIPYPLFEPQTLAFDKKLLSVEHVIRWSLAPDQSITRFVQPAFGISYLILLDERGSCRSLSGFLFHQSCPYPCFSWINSTYIYG